MKKDKIINNRGQIAIWIILAFIIVAIIILFFFFFQKKPTVQNIEDFDPNKYIQICAGKIVTDTVDKMIENGGFVNPVNYKIYDDKKVPYYCENRNLYFPCINQHPLLLNDYKTEILNYTESAIDGCFTGLKKEIEDRGGSVEYKNLNSSIEFSSNKIYFKMNRKATITKNAEIIKVDNFDVEIDSPLYDFGMLAIEIMGREAKKCNFDYTEYMILYKRWDIRKTSMSDATKIYMLKDLDSGKELRIAIRGCVLPAGT